MTLNIQGSLHQVGLLLQRLSDLKILNLTSKKSITNEAAEIARLDAALEKAKLN